VTPTVLNRFFNRYALTPSERRLVKLLLDGITPIEISHLLNHSHRTIKTQLSRIYKKTSQKGALKLVTSIYKDTR